MSFTGHFSHIASKLPFHFVIIQGIGNLFPFNAFISASGYYSMRLCGTPFSTNFEAFFSDSYTVWQLVGVFCALKFQGYIPLKQRVLIPLISYTIIFIATLILTGWEIDTNLFFYITVISTCLSGFFHSMLSGGLYGLTGMLPPQYTSAIMCGSVFAGVCVCVIDIIALLSGKEVSYCSINTETILSSTDGEVNTCVYSFDKSAFGYFSVAVIVMFMCITSFSFVLNIPEIK